MFSGKEPSKEPADLKGRKFRAGALYDNIYKDIGIVGVTMRHGDVYSALEKGVLDGAGSNFGDVVKFRWFEVIKYVYTPPFWKTNNVVLLVNLDKWKSLSKEQQDLLLQSQIDIEKPMWEHFKVGSEKMWETMMNNGMKPSQWSKKDRNGFLERIDNIQWKLEEKRIGAEEVKKLRSLMGY
jgi:TRAP-type C4-dicarboxylate transport system substrate-binding protein